MPSLSNIIGQASRGADLYFVFRFLRLLTMDFKKTDAYKFKIIDDKGNALRKSADLESVKEKAAYTMLHRMVFKIRRLILKVPLVGKSILLNYAAALFLLKEQKNARIWTDDGYMKSKLLEFLETDWEADAKFLKEEVDNMDKKSFKSFLTENEEINEMSAGLQLKMAFDDAKIKIKGTKGGKLVISKKDEKKVEKVIAKQMRKPADAKRVLGSQIVFEEVELDEGGIGAIPLKQLRKQYDKNEDENKHTENYLMLARAFGTPAEVKKVEAIMKKNEKQGHTHRSDMDWMYKNINPYYDKIRKEEVKMDEAKGTAYPATVDTLRKIIKDKQHQTVMFDKGQALVDTFTASAMIAVYDAMKKPDIKKKFEEMIKSKEGFMKTQAFAMKMVK
jgi:hypothetical protein